MTPYFNIASLLTVAAKEHPNEPAVICPHRADVRKRTTLTFRELDLDSSILASSLLKQGLDPGDRVALMVKPGIDFYLLTFALFKAGLVPVMADPGMGIRRMLSCFASGKPKGLIGIKLAHLASLAFPSYFKEIKARVTVGRSLGWGGATLEGLLRQGEPFNSPTLTQETDTAAILFTSGATGPAKGVIYTHAMFRAQVETIRDNLGLKKGEAELVTFPLFGLFTPALSLTSVIADMNPTKPGTADPEKIANAITEFQIKSLFASPALLTRLANYAKEKKIAFSNLRTVICAGAPVRPSLVAQINEALDPEARLFTPYGATEGMPLTLIESHDILAARGMTEQGFGMCVGKPLPGCQIEIISISDKPLNSFQTKDLLRQGEVGELVARGPMVAESYFELPQATALTMVLGPDGQPWRRMGDLGWKDGVGRIWFCGRKSQRVIAATGVFYTIPCEAVFNNHPLVRRSALVGATENEEIVPVLIVEPIKKLDKARWDTLVGELTTLAKANPRTRNIFLFLRKNEFPMDIRHNAKISREKLSVWAQKELDLQS
ncbi:MAG: AMP-binding protein [Deltaproteobacteria bacterium]|jgi:acyl-CoA synthetase (AMP-forming)/AMP-acid ligase II|nr:AMP-binding protein [Deltaproteobacteria bacterium]